MKENDVLFECFYLPSMHLRVPVINPNSDFLEGKLLSKFLLLTKFAALNRANHCGSFISNYDFKEFVRNSQFWGAKVGRKCSHPTPNDSV